MSEHSEKPCVYCGLGHGAHCHEVGRKFHACRVEDGWHPVWRFTPEPFTPKLPEQEWRPRCAELERERDGWIGEAEDKGATARTAFATVARLKKERDELKARLGQKCEHCGYHAIYSGPPDCPYCGAPNCCQHCCQKQRADELKARVEALEKEITAVIEHIPNVRVCEDGAAENICASLAVSVAKQTARIEELENALRDLLSSRYSGDPGAVAEATERAGAVLAGRKGNPQGV